jgi:hypothetical protein
LAVSAAKGSNEPKAEVQNPRCVRSQREKCCGCAN